MDFETCEICGVDLANIPADASADVSAETPAVSQQADPKPEYFQYKDEGCNYARSCLACPYDRCLFDGQHGKRSAMTQIRSREIKKLFKSGRNVKELVDIFGVSNKTIYRAINTTRRKKRKGVNKNG
jgi:hypothetical protein